MSIEVRPMKVSDLTDVLELENICFATPWSEQSFRDELERNVLARLFTACDGEKIVGYCSVMLIINEAHIYNIAVHPDYRQLGVGGMLMQRMMQSAWEEMGITQITLEVRKSNIAARMLYRKFGFAVEGERKKYYSDNNEDALVMWCRDTNPYLLLEK